MDQLLLTPPVAFIIMLSIVLVGARISSKISFKKREGPDESGKSYACGEDAPTHLIQPDYGRFFPFAFFFTILHVVAMIVTTMPMETIESFSVAVIYILGAMVGLVVLFRR